MALATQTQATNANSFYFRLAENTELLDVWLRGRKDPSQLSEMKRNQFFYACVAWFTYHESTYQQVSMKMIPASDLALWKQALTEDMEDAGLRWYWAQESHLYDANFGALVQEMMAYSRQTTPSGSNPPQDQPPQCGHGRDPLQR